MADREIARAPQVVAPRPGGPGGPGGMGRRIEKARDPRGALRRLVSYLRPYGWLLAGVLVLVVINTLLSLAQPYLMGVAIDDFIDPAILPAWPASPCCWWGSIWPIRSLPSARTG
jgi:ATP-binding cassette subfamily B protein